MLSYNEAFSGFKTGTVDIEVLPRWWCVVLSKADGIHVFTSDGHFDRAKLKRILSTMDFVMGYNIRDFDAPLLRMITEGIRPAKLYEAMKLIIEERVPGWQVLQRYCPYAKIDFGVAELMPTREPGGESVALKFVQAITGESVHECPIPFDKVNLTPKDKDEIISYCKNDVAITEKIIFPARRAAIEAEITLAKMCAAVDGKSWQSHLRKTSNSKSAVILGNNSCDYSADEWHQRDLIVTLARRFAPMKVDYKHVYEWFDVECRRFGELARKLNEEDMRKEVRKTKLSITLNNGCKITFGMGGQHGAFERYIKSESVYDSDVSSMYPSIMTEYNLMSRRMTRPQKLVEMTKNRVALKKTDPQAAAAQKIVLVSVFGAMGNRGGPLYDPRMMRGVCITGQLALLKLIEMLEEHVFFINTNTDGIFYTLKTEAVWEDVLSLHAEWGQITSLQLEVNGKTRDEWIEAIPYHAMHQFNVNNYALVKAPGDIIHKGAATSTISGPFSRGEITLPKYDRQVIKHAITEYITNGRPIESTIKSATDFRQFLFVAKSSTQVYQDGELISERILRYALAKKGGSSFTKQTKKSVVTIPEATGAILFHDNLNDLSSKQHMELIASLDIDRYVQIAERLLKGLLNDNSDYSGTFDEFSARYPKWSSLQNHDNFPVHPTNDPDAWEMHDGSFPACLLPCGDVWALDFDDCLYDKPPKVKGYTELIVGKWINSRLLAWLEKLGVYTEFSAGGRGLHCILLANASSVPKKKGATSGAVMIEGHSVEIFNVSQGNHCITITGRRVERLPDEIKYKTAMLKRLLKSLPDAVETVNTLLLTTPPKKMTVYRQSKQMQIIRKTERKVKTGQTRYTAFRDCFYELVQRGYDYTEIKKAEKYLYDNFGYWGAEHADNRKHLEKVILSAKQLPLA